MTRNKARTRAPIHSSSSSVAVVAGTADVLATRTDPI